MQLWNLSPPIRHICSEFVGKLVMVRGRPCTESFWQGGRQTHPVRSCSHRGICGKLQCLAGMAAPWGGGWGGCDGFTRAGLQHSGGAVPGRQLPVFHPCASFSCLVPFKVKSFYCWMDFFVLKELKDLLSGLNAFKQIFF